MFNPTCILVSAACPTGEALIAHNWAASRWKLKGSLAVGCSWQRLERSLPGSPFLGTARGEPLPPSILPPGSMGMGRWHGSSCRIHRD